jgi:hypothetical protein
MEEWYVSPHAFWIPELSALLPKLSQLCLNLLQFAGDLLPSSVLGIKRRRFSFAAIFWRWGR